MGVGEDGIREADRRRGAWLALAGGTRVLADVPPAVGARLSHRHVVLTIPRLLRPLFRSVPVQGSSYTNVFTGTLGDDDIIKGTIAVANVGGTFTAKKQYPNSKMTGTNQDRLTRRRFLGGSVAAAGAIAGSCLGVAASERGPRAAGVGGFPSGFRWGTATAAHQVEGSNVNSDAWLLEHMKPATFAEPSGDACDFHHRYPDDVKLAAGLGFNAFCFSIEWARIEPEQGFYSRATLDHYRTGPRLLPRTRAHA